jgi:hypothetical protein
MTRTRPFPYLFLISGTPNLQFDSEGFASPQVEQSSCQRTILAEKSGGLPGTFIS